ncbi:hypothetical protein NDA12_005917 [Ustilago hordei]|nr:hypothetical protein NDA15_006884 [Ustilago hordei]KAJ1592135.1 hypothetical protein NDA12_005917 [Ustilago hordei]
MADDAPSAATDVRKCAPTNSQPLIGPGHRGKHADLCEHLHRKQVAELSHVSDRGTGILGWFSTTALEVAYYFLVWLPRTWWNTLTSLPALLLDPVGLWSTLTFAVATTFILFIGSIVSAVWRLPVVQSVWRPLSAKKDIGLGNYAYPLIFEFGADPQNKLIRDAAFAVMSDPTGTFARPSSDQERTFDLEVSKLLMMLSALVYERDVGAYHDAARSVSRSKKMKKSLVVGHDTLTDAGKDAYKKLGTADRKINKVANKWGLNYASISELATNTSPLCGAFWHPDYNFIILASKGTNPVEFKEWAIDFTFDYTDGRAWLPGFTKIHAGFYNQIFPQKLNHATGAFPYSEIRSSLIEIVKEIRATSFRNHVNLYVTGHSLGAALASIFYSRAIASPKDFGLNDDGGNQVYVRDAYCFGTPIVGDPDCISAFNQAVHDRDLDHPQTLWRVTNRRDAVATLLPDFGDYNTLRHISSISQLHFAHVGQEVQLTNDTRKVYTGPGTMLPEQTPVNIISHLDRGGDGPEVVLPPIFMVLERVPFVRRLVAHLPSSYWDRLTKVHAEYNVEYIGWH